MLSSPLFSGNTDKCVRTVLCALLSLFLFFFPFSSLTISLVPFFFLSIFITGFLRIFWYLRKIFHVRINQHAADDLHNNEVSRINTRKKDPVLEPWEGCITRLSIEGKIQSESDPLYSIRPIRPSLSFSILSPFLVFRLYRECALCRSPLPLLVFWRKTSFQNEWHRSLYSVDLRRVLLSRKPVNVRVGRRMLWKSVLPGNSSERKQCRVIDEKTQRFDILERSFDIL